jgi:curved DNA-binding protein CbpA
MAPRPPLPDDDLYARLGVPTDASFEAVEVAWRGLLRKHHPDVAGPEALDLAKRINVAHDWLSDPELRNRYDAERRNGGGSTRRRGGGIRDDPTSPRTPVARRPPSTRDRVAGIVERVGRLTRDDLDRLALAEPAPIAFLATLRRFVAADVQSALDDAERAALARLVPAARRDPLIRDAVIGKIADILLADALDELLGDPDGARLRERLTRGWDAAVDQPRYGPATMSVGTFLAALDDLSAKDIRALAATGAPERLGEVPWPGWTSPEEDEALRVSSELAGADAAARIPGQGANAAAARLAAARIAHLLVLRHAISEAAFDRLAQPWLGDLIPRIGPWRARVRNRR